MLFKPRCLLTLAAWRAARDARRGLLNHQPSVRDSGTARGGGGAGGSVVPRGGVWFVRAHSAATPATAAAAAPKSQRNARRLEAYSSAPG
jgi:hypothetical protein